MSEPDYDRLPLLGDSDVRHAWEVWGSRDRLGTMNRLTDQTTLAALATPREGRRISLDLPLNHLRPPLYGRKDFGHRVFDRNRNMVEDELGPLDPQSSSQWDSLRHIRAGRHGHYGGVSADDPGAAELGIDTLVAHGLVMRAVLIDIPRWRAATGVAHDGFAGDAITADDLAACGEFQHLAAFRPGDLLLVRTGWLASYAANGGVAPEHLAMPPATGLEASAKTARYLWDNRFCAVAADNPAVENLPGDPAIGSLHRRLIPALGMPLGELWDLESLAEHCARTGRYDSCVIAVPLRVPGGVASPSNAVAVV